MQGKRAAAVFAVLALAVPGVAHAATPDGFTAEVEIAPGLSGGAPFDTSVGGSTLTWWAADDRGNHYRGQLGSWSGSDTHSDIPRHRYIAAQVATNPPTDVASWPRLRANIGF